MNADPLRVSDLIALLQQHVAEHGDSFAFINTNGSWLAVEKVSHFHGRALIAHAPFNVLR